MPFSRLFNKLCSVICNSVPRAQHELLQSRITKLEDMLANRNASAVIAQSLTVSQHAIHRARTRFNYTGSDSDIRKRIYKLAMRNLAILDSFPDGEYELDTNSRCRIRDNTITTVVPRKGSRK